MYHHQSADSSIPIEHVASCALPTPWATFELHAFAEKTTGKEHLAIVLGSISDGQPVLAYLHLLLGEVDQAREAFTSCASAERQQWAARQQEQSAEQVAVMEPRPNPALDAWTSDLELSSDQLDPARNQVSHSWTPAPPVRKPQQIPPLAPIPVPAAFAPPPTSDPFYRGVSPIGGTACASPLPTRTPSRASPPAPSSRPGRSRWLR